MTATDARSPRALRARGLVDALQKRFAERLEALSARHGHAIELSRVEWLRDEGRHGGGNRRVAVDTPVFNRAAINVSQVHYDDEPQRRLGSATALSTIIHPQAPRAPSVHMHISWTELRDGSGSWRIMADLNPAIADPAATARFASVMRVAAPALYDAAARQGDRYFFIPALGRHRGATHFYVEAHNSGDFEADLRLARGFGEAVIDGYAAEVDSVLATAPAPTDEERTRQLDYHTAYLFQVLTLDRGTTSGLLVHDQNDVGILGSLPARIDRDRLATWAALLPAPQDALVRALVAVLPEAHPCPLTEDTRAVLARVVRDHYRAHPEALELQASGDVVPPTVSNHRVEDDHRRP